MPVAASDTLTPRRRTENALPKFNPQLTLLGLLLLVCALWPHGTCKAQTPATVPVLILSDVHLEVYHDPAKMGRLMSAPASRWGSILAEPDSPTQVRDFEHLRSVCPTRGLDTSPALYAEALRAAKAQVPHPAFVVLPGDLLAHKLDCRFHALEPKASRAAWHRFVDKVEAYVGLQITRTYPGVPVYISLGNNDSACGDYAEDTGSAFLKASARLADRFARQHLQRGSPEQGDYSLTLPAPFVRGRLIVLQDLFEAAQYHTCGNEADPAAAGRQLEYLRSQLSEAKAANQQVWVVAHMPPGVDVFSTVTKARNVCGGGEPDRFLGSDELTDVLTAYAGTVRLALFAHTHMDEIHLLHGSGKPPSPDGTATVAMKQTPSLSPINGNLPSFTVAQVDPGTLVMRDYTVVTAGSLNGGGWKPAYSFGKTYSAAAYTPQALVPLLAAVEADEGGASAPGSEAMRFFFPGDKSALLRLVWPSYTCSFTNTSTADYRACVCRGRTAKPVPELPPAPGKP